MATEIERLNVHGTAGSPIELPISHGALTGHSWTLNLPDGVERIDDGPQKPVDPLTKPGASIRGAIRVKARKGEYQITARLARSWQPENPARVVEIALTVE